MGRSLLLALLLVLSLAVAGTLRAEEIDCVTTEWKLVGANHKVCVRPSKTRTSPASPAT